MTMTATVLLADVVDGADVGMVQRGSGARLALKAAEGLRVARDVVREELQRHETMEADVLGLVDDAHPAGAQLLEDAVVGEVWPMRDRWRR